MIKKIVYFISKPLCHRDYERFGAEIFIKNGFEVVFFNFTPFIYPLVFNKATKKNQYQGDQQKLFFKEEEALSEISKLTKGCFVVSLLHYRHDTFRIYKALSQTIVPYALNLVNCIPTSKVKSSPSDQLFKRISRIRLSRLPIILKNYLFRPDYARYLGIREPVLLLAGGEKSTAHPQCSLIGKNTKILWLHTFDYDIYLKNNNLNPSDHDDNKAVFIDAPSPRFVHDALIPGISSPLTEEKYYPSLCNFFDRLEKELDVKVEIAAHPVSDHEMYPDYFGNRLTLHGQTCEMIRQSKVVITRSSTSASYAVLYNKPVIFHTSSELESQTSPKLSDLTHNMATWYGKKTINIDESLDIDWKRELLINESAYTNYKNMFIKKEGTEDVYLWQTVANRIKEM